MAFRLVVEYTPSSGSVSNIVDIQDCTSATFDNGLLDYWSKSDGSGSEYLGSGYYMYDNSELSSMNWSEGHSSDVYIYKYDSKDDIPTNPGGGGGNNPDTPTNPSDPAGYSLMNINFSYYLDLQPYNMGGNGPTDISAWWINFTKNNNDVDIKYGEDAAGSYEESKSTQALQQNSTIKCPIYNIPDKILINDTNINYDAEYNSKTFSNSTLNVSVYFNRIYYTTKITTNNSLYGVVSIKNKDGASNSSSMTVHAPNTVTLTATPNHGYKFTNWTKDGVGVSTNNPYTFEPNSSDTYCANFEPITYIITATPYNSVHGTVTGGGSYKYNTTATLTAVPKIGYKFSRWVKDGVPGTTESTITVTVTGNAQYVAHFIEDDSQTEQPDIDTNQIATQSLIAAKSNYVFEFTDDGNKCPTKAEISSGSNNIANISNNYTNEQCVKYIDVAFNKININCKIETSIIAFIEAPYVEIFRDNDKFATLYDASGSTSMNVNNDKNSTTQIDCTHLNNSSSKNANLKIRVYAGWTWNRIIKVTCNGKTIESGQTKDFTANFTNIYFKDFLKNKYAVNVFIHE